MLAPKPPFNRKQKLFSLRKIKIKKPLGIPWLDRHNSLSFSVWRRRLRRGNKLLIHRPHQTYELVLTFLPCCTGTDNQLSIRGEYTRALLLTQYHANKKVPLNIEVYRIDLVLGAGNTRVEAVKVLQLSSLSSSTLPMPMLPA
jgi:hypothetical protein